MSEIKKCRNTLVLVCNLLLSVMYLQILCYTIEGCNFFSLIAPLESEMREDRIYREQHMIIMIFIILNIEF